MKYPIKLTRHQNAIINLLQNGWCLVTNDPRRVYCCGDKSQFEFTWSLLMRLVNMGLIKQHYAYPFDYVLTIEGENIKTKKVDLI